jgi:hypothetical protein
MPRLRQRPARSELVSDVLGDRRLRLRHRAKTDRGAREVSLRGGQGHSHALGDLAELPLLDIAQMNHLAACRPQSLEDFARPSRDLLRLDRVLGRAKLRKFPGGREPLAPSPTSAPTLDGRKAERNPDEKAAERCRVTQSPQAPEASGEDLLDAVVQVRSGDRCAQNAADHWHVTRHDGPGRGRFPREGRPNQCRVSNPRSSIATRVGARPCHLPQELGSIPAGRHKIARRAGRSLRLLATLSCAAAHNLPLRYDPVISSQILPALPPRACRSILTSQ